jgi:hypothetical protein
MPAWTAAATVLPTTPRPEAREWLTVLGSRKVLAVAHTVTYAKRLLDVLDVLEGDFRVQVVFTVPPHVFGAGVKAFLARRGCATVPWDQAVRNDYDLALTAGPGGIEQVRAPLITMPHGAGYLKRITGTADDGVAGMRRRDLFPGGRAPAAVVLPHRDELDELRRHCPPAVPFAHVVGDPVHDRIVASRARRGAYRTALGLRAGQKLLVAVSTWGPRSSFARFEALLPRLMSELPARGFRTAVLLHPNAWAAHGPWQINAWLARCRQAGISLVPPEADWRSVLVAADWVLGDHGSVTLYSLLTQAAVLLATPTPDDEVNPASPAAALALAVPTLTASHPLLEQLQYAAAERRDEERAAITARITSEPGRFNSRMRRLMYRVMRLGEPAHRPATVPLPKPPPLDTAAQGTGGVPA